MRIHCMLLLCGAVALAPGGCGPRKSFDGPTVDAFNGRVTSNGKPLTVAPNEKVQLKLFHETGQSFGIPVQPDGTFKIGWMPTGKYSVTMVRERPPAPGKKGSRPTTTSVPGGLTIQDGQTEYTIEVGGKAGS